MGLRKILNEHKKIIIIVVSLIVAFIIYRYFVKKKNIFKDFSINNLESNFGLIPNSNTKTNSLVASGGLSEPPKCLDITVQKRIADSIDQKLNEINYCDCSQFCATYNKKIPTDNNIIETFYSRII